MNITENVESIEDNKEQYRKVQSLVGEHSFSIVLPKLYALKLGLGKGDFVKVRYDSNRIIIEKAV
ncbi:AbrB/MazE/SpoVT family DNA-binding domain-containing protein [Candidatus Nitrosocosmicus franklandus]|uniref:SpoVT-AbrB domain-containing protein n=1 Tax=Candidatus Nitrosocosmicus franklandianus TaxID=1798806 RepID=A0A484IBN0_9ARCH|nr:AbrB/MazE/SpoVT family DNA-binding domain-containing protein [Candidatus Nitrosocosmicus franklandus]VFJ14488.1 conserved protein of unknown function [Candidatus Nitrosocosmicus franklandus]